ncbi:hypothetical protein MA16_Dca010652 [Dendrobium catenatum]|uniref:Uncharacterized protein n=1 Tax=Dendrobium catenatum TaxID=906689 RepID=A0A2I0VZT2_9ASPA|nr:hypothetical protein MA16_Dca010652 [Dendrobium catenatum]
MYTHPETANQAQASLLGVKANRASRSGGWKYPPLGGSRPFPVAGDDLFLGGGGHGISDGILQLIFFGVSHPSSSLASTISSLFSLSLALKKRIFEMLRKRGKGLRAFYSKMSLASNGRLR